MPKSNDLPPLSDAQLEIMNLIWDRGEATVADVWGAIASRRPVARNTILTLITRLEEKGHLRHRAKGNTFVYSAVEPRETALARLVGGLVETAFRGSAEGLVMSLLEARGLSPGEAKRIRAMLAPLPSKAQRKTP